MICIYIYFIWLIFILLICSGDIETNPGPKSKSCQSFSICHWNLNSISAHNFTKLSLLQAYNSVHNYDIICLSETYLNSSVSCDDDNLEIPGYNLIGADHPSDNRRGGVCVYYKNTLPLKLVNINYLQECLNFEVKIVNKLCNFISLYRSPSQSQDNFETFIDNLELNIDEIAARNPFLIVILGDFNAKLNTWCKSDKTTYEGSKIDGLTSNFGLQQLIKEPTHIIGNSSSCIDLLFCSQPNLVMESGVHPSLHTSCHHQIIYAKFIKIYYPPPYEREIWHYEAAKIYKVIKNAISEFFWERAFENRSIGEKVSIFNKTIKNILSNYIPHETITIDDRDPPWINKTVKTLIEKKSKAYHLYKQNKQNIALFEKFQSLQIQLNDLIEHRKQSYYSRLVDKLRDKKTSPKAYWSLLKTFLNNKKIPCIPPLFHDNDFATDFQKKAEIFNNFFAKQCTVVPNSSILPSVFIRKTNKSLSTLTFCSDEIKKVIRNLDSNKAHGHDMLSIRMLKICDDSLCGPLELIFHSCIETGKFPSDWKKANICPVHKKSDKQIVKNYRPISLLPICGKIFERLLYNKIFHFFQENNLISPSQSGFKPGDSCTNQLLSITHEIYKSFDNGFEVRGVFLDISKAFDKVWHKGLLHKLKQNGISGKLLSVIADFLSNRKQRVVLNGKSSSWTNVEAGVPQGSILGPLFFLIYINDLSDNLKTNPKLFADDTSLFSIVHDLNVPANDLNHDLKKINDWAYEWKMNGK